MITRRRVSLSLVAALGALAVRTGRAQARPAFEEMIRRPVVHSVPGMADVSVREALVYKSVEGSSLHFDVYARLSAIAALGHDASNAPPILLARAGRDDPAINSTIDQFVAAAKSAGAKVDLLTHPTGQHAFDILDPGETSSQIIQRTLEALRDVLEQALCDEGRRRVSSRSGRPRWRDVVPPLGTRLFTANSLSRGPTLDTVTVQRVDMVAGQIVTSKSNRKRAAHAEGLNDVGVAVVSLGGDISTAQRLRATASNYLASRVGGGGARTSLRPLLSLVLSPTACT